ncbi:MAG TPA: phage/plasmid primase, P4 family, partial [Casimicrobiaceae bacterium]
MSKDSHLRELETATVVITCEAQSIKHSLRDAALAYAAQGFAVFPLHNPLPNGSCSCGKSGCGSIGKHPRTSNGLKAATTDSEQIRQWWISWPEANIGIATGAVSNLLVVDVDGTEGEESLRRMTESRGPLPATRMAKTGRGRHLYFRHPGGKIKSKAPICADHPHVDSRGDGGYVVAPPSLHSSGVRYAGDQTMPSELADPPRWLVDLISGQGCEHATPAGVASNDALVEGSRNDGLTSLAGTMRRRGMSPAAIEAALIAENGQRCSPPLPEDEVQAIACSISNYAPGSPTDVLRTLNDAGNAERYAKQWGYGVRYVPELGKWLVWNDPHWQLDTVGETMEFAKKTAYEIYAEGNQINDTQVRDLIVRHSKTSQQAPRLNAMLELAKSIPSLVLPIAELDADPWLLGVENGTVDLRSGRLLEAVPEQYIAKMAPVAFDATAECPAFLQFLSDIMGGDQELVGYLQRLLGYMLTGDASEQRLFFLYGTGANGKSTLLNICKGILGADLCRQTPVETIMARAGKAGPTPELACLVGARAVMTTEIDEGSFLSESLVKQMTGGDPLSARPLYGAPFEFVPQFKLFVAGNHKPVIRGGDDGIWRRIDMIPFEVTIPPDRRDPELAAKLRRELPGILNWALAGCRAWIKRRLDPPPAVVNAVAEYREDMDILGQWIAERC